MSASKVEEVVMAGAIVVAKLAVTSRMARVPLEAQLPKFLGLPVRVETLRLPSKSTRITVACGRHLARRVVRDPTAKAIQQAASTTIRRILGEVALEFVLSEE